LGALVLSPCGKQLILSRSPTTKEFIVYDRDELTGTLKWNMSYRGANTGFGDCDDVCISSDGSKIVYTAVDGFPNLGFVGVLNRFPGSGRLEYLTRLFPQTGNGVTPSNPSSVVFSPMGEHLYAAANNQDSGLRRFPMAALYAPAGEAGTGDPVRMMSSAVLYPCGMSTQPDPWYPDDDEGEGGIEGESCSCIDVRGLNSHDAEAAIDAAGHFVLARLGSGPVVVDQYPACDTPEGSGGCSLPYVLYFGEEWGNLENVVIGSVDMGTVVISVTPPEASWSFTVGEGQLLSGTGPQTVTEVPAGSITLTWVPLENYITPDMPEPQVLL
jgi:hypothetical protein